MRGSPAHNVFDKLKAAKAALKSWNKSEVGNLFHREENQRDPSYGDGGRVHSREPLGAQRFGESV